MLMMVLIMKSEGSKSVVLINKVRWECFRIVLSIKPEKKSRYIIYNKMKCKETKWRRKGLLLYSWTRNFCSSYISWVNAEEHSTKVEKCSKVQST